MPATIANAARSSSPRTERASRAWCPRIPPTHRPSESSGWRSSRPTAGSPRARSSSDGSGSSWRAPRTDDTAPIRACRPSERGGNALDEPLTPDALRLLTSLYRRLASDAREWSLPLGLVLVPHKGCFEAGSRAACDAKLDTVARVAAEAGLAVLDLRPAFAARSIETDYYPHDLHWTAAGHVAATAPIADFIVRLEARTGGSERPST
ncbi:MAG: hypothetical protein U0610_01355 [bacterium]